MNARLFLPIIIAGTGLLVVLAPPTYAEKRPEAAASPASAAAIDPGLSKVPTYITAANLTLFTDTRRFTYSGKVDVKQGDMTLTSESLDGSYDENNKILELAALKNVVVTKGEKMRATGQRATYDAAARTVVLTENPALEQDGSTLSADIIRIYLDENRSTAEGNVKVMLLNKEKDEPSGLQP